MTASLSVASTSSSRRALLAGALGGIGAWAASAIGRARPVRAEGEIIHVGQELATATSLTRLTNAANDANVFEASSTGDGVAIRGISTSSFGVWGSSNESYGVFGFSHSASQPASVGWSADDVTGVQGYSGLGSLPMARAKTGVFGYAAQDSTSKGVWGESPAGHAVQGTSASGYAGYFVGKVYTSKFHELTEIAAPGAPGANKGRLFLRDNGSGKTQLCIRFNTGGVVVIATQP